MFNLPFEKKEFDLIMSCGLLEHFELTEVKQAVAEMKKVGNSVVAWIPTCGIEWKALWTIRNLLGGRIVSKSYQYKKGDLNDLFTSLGFKNIRVGTVLFAGFLRYIYIYGTDTD